jgi:predicted MFS family arabinose efflux permease
MLALQMSSLGFSPLLPSIQQEFGMTYSQVGLFTGMYGILAIVWSIPAGFFAKKIGKNWALLLSGIIFHYISSLPAKRIANRLRAFFH